MDIRKALVEWEQEIRRDERQKMLARLGGEGNGVKKKLRRVAAKRNVPTTCLKPGCRNKPTGPRFSWLCSEHRDKATKAEKKKWLDSWRNDAGSKV